jgi:zinc transport system substrate-binding protein
LIREIVSGVVISLTLLFSNLSAAAQEEGAPPSVLASSRPIHSIVSVVMSGAGTPELLISGSASPHAYALKPSDAVRLENAQIIFWIGPELETFLRTPLATLGAAARIYALADTPGLMTLPLRKGGLWEQHEHDGTEGGSSEFENSGEATDPHFWLDPENGAAMARAIAGVLAEGDPERAARYHDNAEGFAARMAELDAALSERMRPVASQSYIVFHDAYHYFETRYGLSPIGSVSVAADRPAGVRRVIEIRDRIARTDVKCVFSPPQFSPRLIAVLTEKSDTHRAILDELGTDITAGPGLYEALLVRLADGFLSCLAH